MNFFVNYFLLLCLNYEVRIQTRIHIRHGHRDTTKLKNIEHETRYVYTY